MQQAELGEPSFSSANTMDANSQALTANLEPEATTMSTSEEQAMQPTATVISSGIDLGIEPTATIITSGLKPRMQQAATVISSEIDSGMEPTATLEPGMEPADSDLVPGVEQVTAVMSSDLEPVATDDLEPGVEPAATAVAIDSTGFDTSSLQLSEFTSQKLAEGEVAVYSRVVAGPSATVTSEEQQLQQQFNTESIGSPGRESHLNCGTQVNLHKQIAIYNWC